MNELEKRRTDFRGGVPVKMADGQEWTLPVPKRLYVPDDSEDGYALRSDLGPIFDGLMEAYRKVEAGLSIIGSEMRIFRHLLGLNYDLSTTEAASLIQLDYTVEPDEPGGELRRALLDVTFGRVGSPNVPKSDSGPG